MAGRRGMLIRNAEIHNIGTADLRIMQGRIAEIGQLRPFPGEGVFEAGGGALLPGLHDHHIHLAGLAARAASIWCGPPEVMDAEALKERLVRPGEGWIRGIGYHESVMGLPTARELDRLVSDRPLRLQHRSGRMWLFNTAALAELLAEAEAPPGLERNGSIYTGRLFDEDEWLRRALASQPPDFAAVSAELARYGISGVSDMSPRNDPVMAKHVAAQMEAGMLAQRCWLAGSLTLAESREGPWRIGPAKLHLHESALPLFEAASSFIAEAHDQGRNVAIHCTTEVELVFALAALEDAGVTPGDRIEHASVAALDHVTRIAAHNIAVVVQPHFVFERGDRYLIDVEARHMGDLYRLASLRRAGVMLAGGSDAPFGAADPWQAMAAAVTRRTRDGNIIGSDEALSPEEALGLYLAVPFDLARQQRIGVDELADLCLLDRPWREARRRLFSDDVRATFIGGRLVYERIDQPPDQCLAGVEALAGKDHLGGTLSPNSPRE